MTRDEVAALLRTLNLQAELTSGEGSGLSAHIGLLQWARLRRAAKAGHDGDCVKQPQPCAACEVERWRLAADQWVAMDYDVRALMDAPEICAVALRDSKTCGARDKALEWLRGHGLIL